MTRPNKIPAPETDFLDPRTGKISTLWYQYLQKFDKETTAVVNNITYGTFLRNSGSFMSGSGSDSDPEPGPRGLPGRNGRDGVTKIVYVYLPADENEPMTVYRKLA